MQPYFHTTSFATVSQIAEEGLRPRSGAGTFQHGGYGAHSQGKVFAVEAGGALEWFGKIEDQSGHHYADDDEPDRLVPVMLRLSLVGFKLHADEIGSRDVWGGKSVYVTETVPPENIEYWSPAADAWLDLWEFDASEPEDDVYVGVSEIEHYNYEGDVVEEDDDWDTRGFTVIGPYNDGGFKPDRDDGSAWTMGWPGAAAAVETLPAGPVYYRGTKPGDTRRIRTGAAGWDRYLFVTDTPEGARMYGPQVEEVRFKAGTRVLR